MKKWMLWPVLFLLFLLPSCSSDDGEEGGGGLYGDTWGISGEECTVEGGDVAVSFDLVRPFGVQPEGVKVACNGQEYAVEATSEWNCRASIPRRGLMSGQIYKVEVYAVAGGVENLAGSCEFRNEAGEAWPTFENLEFGQGADAPTLQGSFTWQDGDMAVEEAGIMLLEREAMPSSYTPGDLWAIGQRGEAAVSGQSASVAFDGLKWGTEYRLLPYAVTSAGIVLGGATDLQTRLPFRITVTEPGRYAEMPLEYRFEVEYIDPSCKINRLGTTAFGEPGDLVSGIVRWDDEVAKESGSVFIHSIGLRDGASYSFGLIMAWEDGEGNVHGMKTSEIVDGKRYYFRANF